jgi:hypothetical protein
MKDDRAEALRRALIEIDREISYGSYIEYVQQIARKALDADQVMQKDAEHYRHALDR